MKVTLIRTKIIRPHHGSMFSILDAHLPRLREWSILVVTSKIVAITQGRVMRTADAAKDTLVRNEADFFIPKQRSRYGITLTIKDSILIPSAGIDESNGGGHYVLWPANPQRTANAIRRYLRRRFDLREVGVLITDSKTTPLRRGTTGVALAYSGFRALNSYIGRRDLFGRRLRVTQANVADALAAAAVAAMGEGNERTPLAVIADVPFIVFQRRDPTLRALAALRIPIAEDLYAPLLRGARWLRGGKRRRRSLR